MPLTDPSIPDLLRERASEQANARAYTFVDHDIDPNGFPESLTWSQVHRQAQVIAEELRLCGSPGDRAAITGSSGTRLHRRFPRRAAGRLHRRSAIRAAAGQSRRTGFVCAARLPAIGHPHHLRGRRRRHPIRTRPRRPFRSVHHRGRFIRPRLTRHRRFGRTRGEDGIPAVHLWVDTHAYRCSHFPPECHRQSSTGAVRLLP